MTSLTSPSNLVIWTGSDPQSLATASAAMMASVQAAIKNQQLNTFRWANSTDRGLQAGMVDGDIGVQIDNDTLWLYTGSAWAPLISAPATYPVGFVNLTVGNAEVQSSFTQLGNRVFVDGSIKFGSSTSITGAVGISLPVTESAFYKTSGSQKYVGGCQILDVGVQGTPGFVYINAANPGFAQLQRMAKDPASNNILQYSVNTNTPFPMSSGDIISWSFDYQRA